MSVKTSEELLEAIRVTIGENNSDEAISLLEDITDTYADLENRIATAGDWKKKYEENDSNWRAKYKERFYNGSTEEEDQEQEQEDKKQPMTFADLFSKGD